MNDPYLITLLAGPVNSHNLTTLHRVEIKHLLTALREYTNI